MRNSMRRAATQLVLVLALTVGPFALAGQAQAAARPMSTGCGSVVESEPVFFDDISTTEPVASFKLMSGGCAYLWMWSWFTASHSGWDVGLTTCPGDYPSGGYIVYPVTNGNGEIFDGCASPYVWMNSRQQEFYGPAAAYGCEFATIQLIYNHDDFVDATDSWCFA